VGPRRPQGQQAGRVVECWRRGVGRRPQTPVVAEVLRGHRGWKEAHPWERLVVGQVVVVGRGRVGGRHFFLGRPPSHLGR